MGFIPPAERGRFSYIARVVILAAAYVAAAKLGLSLSVAHGNATPVWAPSGIALAALVLFGPRLWPGVLLGAFIANATTPVPLWVAGAIAVGNTAEGAGAAWLMRRLRMRAELERGRDVMALFAALLSPVIAASVGVTALTVGNEVPTSDYFFHWRVWAVGDAMGILLVGSLLLTWASQERRAPSLPKLVEAFLLLTSLVAIGALVFSREPPVASFMVFPLIVWATLRFGQRGASAATVVATAFGIAAVLGGARPFGGVTVTETVELLQALMGLVLGSSLLVAAAISERDNARVALAGETQQLEEAQMVAHLGSWEWDIATGDIRWSDELFRIHGYEPGSAEVTFEWVLSHVVEEDRAAIRANVEEGMAGPDRPLPSIEYQIVRPDGSPRKLRGEGRFTFTDGVPVRMLGTVQDVTELRDAQAAAARLREVEANHRQALELNDEVVQAIAVAKLALELGHTEEALAAIESALQSSREIVTDLMSKNGSSKAGGFRRERPAHR